MFAGGLAQDVGTQFEINVLATGCHRASASRSSGAMFCMRPPGTRMNAVRAVYSAEARLQDPGVANSLALGTVLALNHEPSEVPNAKVLSVAQGEPAMRTWRFNLIAFALFGAATLAVLAVNSHTAKAACSCVRLDSEGHSWCDDRPHDQCHKMVSGGVTVLCHWEDGPCQSGSNLPPNGCPPNAPKKCDDQCVPSGTQCP